MPMWAISLGIAGGGMALQYLLAPKVKQKPTDVGKFDDIRIQGADYGAFIPRGWGRFRCAGNLVFSNGIQHYIVDSPTGGGKGVPQAPATRTHVYKSSIGVMVCRGPIQLYRTIWEDADILTGGVGPSQTRLRFEAEDATLSGGASITTSGNASGGEYVTNLVMGTVAYDFTSFSPPDNPYDPDDEAEPKTAIEIGYRNGLTDRTSSVTTNDGTGPIVETVTMPGIPADDGNFSSIAIVRNGFVETMSVTNSAPGMDFADVTYYWQPNNIALPFPYQNRKVTGIVDPNTAYPGDLNDPSPYYNYDPENGKDAVTGTYNLTPPLPGDVWRWYTGTESQTQDAAIAAWLDGRYGTGQGILRTSAMRGLAYMFIQDYTLKQGRVPNFTFEIEEGHPDVNDVLVDLFADVGIDAADYDLSDTASLTQLGFFEGSTTSRKNLIEQLERYHLFRLGEIDGKIYSIPDSVTSVATIDQNLLRAHNDDEDMPAFDAELLIKEEQLMPREVRVSIMNPTRDFHNETATAQLFTVPGTESKEYSFAIVDDLENARLSAEKLLLKEHSEDKAIEFWGMPELMKWSIGDTVTVPINGAATKLRIEKKQVTLPLGKIRFQGVSVNPFVPSVFQSDTTASVSLAREQVASFNYPRNTVVVPIQSVAIRDADKGKTGLYLAISGRGRGAGDNAALYREMGDGNYVLQFVQDTNAEVGLTDGTLGTHSPITTKDTTNTLDIWFFDEVELESVDTATIDRYPVVNLLRVGNEWLQFETAVAQTLEDNSPYRSKWRVSNLWRGRFETSTTVSTHTAGEYVAHVTNALRFYALEPDDIGQVIRLKAVTGGQDIDNAPATVFTFAPLSTGLAATLLSSTVVATNSAARQDLYDVPAGQKCVVTEIVIRESQVSLSTLTDGLYFGFETANDVGYATKEYLTGLVKPNVRSVWTPLVSESDATAVVGIITQTLTAQFLDTSITGTVIIDVFGYLYPDSTNYVLFAGEPVTFLGEPWTFTP